MRADPLLEVRGLRVHFVIEEGTVKAVDGVDFSIHRGQTVCVVGESGCGKSVTARSILRLVDRPGRIVSGSILYRPEPDGAGPGGARPGGPTPAPLDLATLDPRGRQIRAVRGRQIAMVFQEPMTSLSLVHTIGDQISEGIR